MALDDYTYLELLRAIAPRFAGRTDDALNVFIDLAVARLNTSVWLASGVDMYKKGVVYLAAHLLTLTDRDDPTSSGFNGGAVGPLTGRSTGQHSEQYGWPGSTGGTPGQRYFEQTGYGTTFWQLVRSLGAAKPLSSADLDWT